MNHLRRALVVICLSLSLVLVVVVKFELNAAASSNNSLANEAAFESAWQAATTPQAGAVKEKTIGETQKNIKVLNDVPASQLIPMMNLMAGSLGVRCNFCHVNNNGQWNYAADDKPEKNTAREMITMTLNINKSTFKGNTEVSCFTCHRGRNRPVGVIELPVPEPTPRPAAQTPAPGAAATQPTVDDILNKYTTAIGGQAAVDKLKTRSMKGTYTLANGMTGSYEIVQAAPDKFYVARGTQQGLAEQGYNGAEGWQKDPRGVAEIRADQLADLKFAHQFFRDLRFKEQFTRTSVRRDKIDGRDVFVVTGLRPDKKRERLFFDGESGLLVRRIVYTETPIGLVPDQTDFEDYRDVDGVKVPFTIKSYAVGGFSTAVRKLTEVKFNAPVEDSRFNKPAGSAPANP